MRSKHTEDAPNPRHTPMQGIRFGGMNFDRLNIEPGGPAWIWPVLILGTVVIIATRLTQLGSLSDQGEFLKYTFYAAEIIKGRIPIDRLQDLSPGYLWAVSGLYALSGPSFELLRALQVCMLGVAALLAALTASRWGGIVAGVAAWLTLLFSRAALVNASEAEPETLLLLLHCAAIWLLLRHNPEKSDRHQIFVILAGAVIGLATVTRPSSAMVIPFWCLWLWWASRRPLSKQCDVQSTSRINQFTPVFRLLAGFALAPVVVLLLHLSLTGTATLMNPGTVSYEGMNPRATGFSGEAPSIVKQIEPSFSQPDALHLSYRRLASLDSGVDATPSEANRFWTRKALRFVMSYPRAAATLVVRKALSAFSSYEVYDLRSMMQRDMELRATGPWFSFGFLVAIATVGMLASRKTVAFPLLTHASISFIIMTVFYVSSRQRNAALPALAILAGLGVAHLIQLWASKRRVFALTLTIFIVVFSLAANYTTHAQREDMHRWRAANAAAHIEDSIRLAIAQGMPQKARWLAAEATTWQQDTGRTAAPSLVQQQIIRLLPQVNDPERRFDLSLAAMQAGDWATAAHLLKELERIHYYPVRGAGVASTLAYHQARCALHLGENERAVSFTATALRQAPGDPDVLELALALAGSSAEMAGRLPSIQSASAFSDGVTVALSRAKALSDVGRPLDAELSLEILLSEAPELQSIVSRYRTQIGLLEPGT
ncbi:MAG: hypothetical protein GY906_34750 [bacterium]|nr:hypothetical protein [bacterium]